MKILVTGGAGYIGSFMTKRLLERGDKVVVIDNLERGHREAIDSRASFAELDMRSLSSLEDLFHKESFDAVLHFAGYISVEESSKYPQKYYENNVVGAQNLFRAAINIASVGKFIFSSSAAVYGNPIKIPIPEGHPKNPTNPYGETKLAIEEILQSLSSEYKSIKFAALRYFNACGAKLDGSMGEDHNPETHIIPLAIQAAIKGEEFNLYGTDYDTFDGTCIRDYIHILDLVEAHVLALEGMEKEKGGFYYNVGTGNGFSNRQVADMVKKISGVNFKIVEKARRSGDADQLIADPKKIREELGFEPKYSDLETIISSAWKWHKRNLR